VKEKAFALLDQMRALWAALSTPKRISLIVVTLAVVVGVLTYSVLSTRQTYAYLFTELSPEDAAAIAGKLKELKVPYRVEAGGTAIEVVDERVHELRLELAGQGLPRGGGVGFEIFDKSHLGATEFEQRINLRRALEGELARTIGTIGSVQNARVHLVMPEHSVFAIAKQEATASVVLRLRPGRPFGKGEVGSVVHLVASAVPGLSADRVSVVSADGVMLHRPRSESQASGVAAGDSEVDHEREVAQGLEEQARTLLERVVGPGHADVRIGLTIDSASRERMEEHYEPSKTALRSEQKSEEKATPEAATVAGVPGAASNLPDGTAEPLGGGAAANGAFRTSWTRNWEVDRVTEKTNTPAGRVSRLTVAALVDGAYRTNAQGGRDFVPRDKVELERLAVLVKQAVGFNAERGDVVEIDCAPFAGGEGLEAPKVENEKVRRLYWYGAGGAVALLLLAVVILTWRGSKKKKILALKLNPVMVPAALEGASTAPELPAGPQVEPGALRARALEIAMKDPATAAIILRGWLNAPST
jgi:flagellar M-ring protein FliF